MQDLRQHWFIAACVIVVAALSGCAATQEFPPPSEDLRQQLGRLALVSLDAEHNPSLDTPAKGSGAGALKGAEQGAVNSIGFGLAGCSGAPDPYVCGAGLALGLAMAPIAALVGAGIGAGRAHSAEEVEAADAALGAALARIDYRGELQDAVEAALGARAYSLPDPPAGDEESADYRPLAQESIDTVLELHASSFYVTDDGDIDPDVTLLMGARARLVGMADNGEVYKRVWVYRSAEHNYFDLAAEEARLLRTEISEGFAKLGERVVFDLFVNTEVETRTKGRSPEPGTVRTINVSPRPDPGEGEEDPATGGAAEPD